MNQLKPVYRKFWKERIFFIFGFMGNELVGLVLIDRLQKLIDMAAQMDISRFWQLALEFFGILIISIGIIILDQYFFRALAYYGEMELKKYTFAAFLQNYTGNKKKNLGESISAIHNDTAVVSNWLSKGPVNMVLQSLILLIYLVLMARYHWPLTLLTLAVILIVFALSRYFGEKESQFTAGQQKLYGRLYSYLQSCLENFPMICQLHNGDYFYKRLKALHRQGDREVISGLSHFMALSDAMLTFMVNTLPLLIFALSLLFVKMGEITAGGAVALLLLSHKLNQPIILLAALVVDRQNAQTVYDQMKDIYIPWQEENGEKEPAAFAEMEVKLKTYQYDGGEVSLSADFTIGKGDTVLIKGESGSGKSTILNLLSRFLRFQGLDGSIKYNGTSVSEYDKSKYYQHILQVQQETVLIEGSILENLLLGDSYSKEEIDEVIKTCVLDEFCREKGMDFFIQENGKNISGGERQRLGLARMLLRKPEVLILDEVTSALDEATRQLLLQRLTAYQQKHQMTMVAVSHNHDFDRYSNKIVELGRNFV